MDTGEFEDTLRYITGTATGFAALSRESGRGKDWAEVREGLSLIVRRLQEEVAESSALDGPLVQEEIRAFGLGRSVDALADPSAGEVERAYRVAFGLAYSLQAILNQVGSAVEG